MVRSRIFLLTLFNLVHLYNSLQHSDWTYDREIGTVNITANGSTYECLPRDIIEPITIRYFNSVDKPCLYEWEVPPTCMPTEFLRVLSTSMLGWDNETSCHVIVPTAEDVLEKVEKVYRSSSLDDHPATEEWYDQVLQNVTQIAHDCQDIPTKVFISQERAVIQDSAQTALNNRIAWFQLRNNVSSLQTAFDEALPPGVDVRSLFTTITFEHERRDRERLLAVELSALIRHHNDEYVLTTWYTLAEMRANFVKKMSLNMKTDHLVAAGTRNAAEIRMNLLMRMARANEMLARSQAVAEEIASSMKYVCIPRSQLENMRN